MPDSFQVETDQVRSHARQVSGVRDQADTALQAAHQVSPQGFDLAYGLICQFFPPLVRPVEQRGVDAISAAVDRLYSTVKNLDDVASEYERVEDEILLLIQKMLAQLSDTAPILGVPMAAAVTPVDPAAEPAWPSPRHLTPPPPLHDTGDRPGRESDEIGIAHV